MSAAEAAVSKRPGSDKEETSDSEASAADPKPASAPTAAAASAPINKQQQQQKGQAPQAGNKAVVQTTQAVIESIITREKAQETDPNTVPPNNTLPKRRMKKAQKTRQVELDPPVDKEEEEEEEEGSEEEPSQAVIAIQKASGRLLALVLALVKSILGLVCCSVRMAIGLLPTSLHLAVFLGLLYLTAQYVVTPLPAYVDFVGRLRYVIKLLVCTLLPAVLGFLVSNVKKAEGHKKFADETFRLVGMLGLNSTIFSTYTTADYMHYVWSLHFLVGVYSVGYWASLIYGGPSTRKAFYQPSRAVLFLLMIWNFWTVISQDLGLTEAQPISPPPQAVSSGGRGLHYWQYATMCEMVERVFCSADQGHRAFYL